LLLADLGPVMSAALVVAGWVVLIILTAFWFHVATSGDTPTDPIDDEWRRLCDDEEGVER
jgi:hypothetical protein